MVKKAHLLLQLINTQTSCQDAKGNFHLGREFLFKLTTSIWASCDLVVVYFLIDGCRRNMETCHETKTN